MFRKQKQNQASKHYNDSNLTATAAKRPFYFLHSPSFPLSEAQLAHETQEWKEGGVRAGYKMKSGEAKRRPSKSLSLSQAFDVLGDWMEENRGGDGEEEEKDSAVG